MIDKLYLLEYNEKIELDISDILPLNVKKHILNKTKKEESLMGYLLLVYALREYYGKLIIPDIDYESKPKLIDYNIYFNISHSNNIIVLAFSDNKEIGVDIEKIREYSLRLRDRICNDFEKNKIKTDEDLIDIWTKKEAYVKLFGKSIFSNIKSIDLSSKEIESMRYKDFIISVCYEKK